MASTGLAGGGASAEPLAALARDHAVALELALEMALELGQALALAMDQALALALEQALALPPSLADLRASALGD